MNDQEIIVAVRRSMERVHLNRDVEAIQRRGRRSRNRRRAAVASGAGAMALAVAGLALWLPGSGGGHGPGVTAAAPVHVRLEGFTVDTGDAGSLTLTIDESRLRDPAALSRVLEQAGVPATVRVGVVCRSDRALPETRQVVTGAPPPRVWTIRPSALPPGARLAISVAEVAPGAAVVSVQAVPADAVLTCQAPPAPRGTPHSS